MAAARRARLVALLLLSSARLLATRADEEAHGGCDAATGGGVAPAPLFATPVTLASLNFGSGAGAAPVAGTGATARGCARLGTCGTCAAVSGCAWCGNAWSQSCVDADAPAAGCACAGSAVTSFSLCSTPSAAAEQAARVEAPADLPTCDAAAAGTVVVDVSVSVAGGEFLGCTGATGAWVSLGGGGGSAVIAPPVLTAVASVALPFSDGGALTRLDPAPLSVFARADATVAVELVAAGCVMSVEGTAVPDGVALSVPVALSGMSGVRLEGPMNGVNLALEEVELGCHCIGASGVTSISSSVTSAGVTATASIPVAVGAVAELTVLSGKVYHFATGAAVAGASVHVSYEGLDSAAAAAADCVIGTATTAVDGTWTQSTPSAYLVQSAGHAISMVATDGNLIGRVRTGFAAVSGSVTAPKISISPTSASTGTAQGVVIAAATKEAMGGALVQLQRIVDPGSNLIAATETMSDANGEFIFSSVESGAYQLVASRAFASLLVQSVIVTAGETTSALLAPLASERAGANHFRAVLQWLADGAYSGQCNIHQIHCYLHRFCVHV